MVSCLKVLISSGSVADRGSRISPPGRLHDFLKHTSSFQSQMSSFEMQIATVGVVRQQRAYVRTTSDSFQNGVRLGDKERVRPVTIHYSRLLPAITRNYHRNYPQIEWPTYPVESPGSHPAGY